MLTIEEMRAFSQSILGNETEEPETMKFWRMVDVMPVEEFQKLEREDPSLVKSLKKMAPWASISYVRWPNGRSLWLAKRSNDPRLIAREEIAIAKQREARAFFAAAEAAARPSGPTEWVTPNGSRVVLPPLEPAPEGWVRTFPDSK